MSIKHFVAQLHRHSLALITHHYMKFMVLGLGLAIAAWYGVLTPNESTHDFTHSFDGNDDNAVVIARIFAGLFFYSGLIGYFRTVHMKHFHDVDKKENKDV